MILPFYSINRTQQKCWWCSINSIKPLLYYVCLYSHAYAELLKYFSTRSSPYFRGLGELQYPIHHRIYITQLQCSLLYLLLTFLLRHQCINFLLNLLCGHFLKKNINKGYKFSSWHFRIWIYKNMQFKGRNQFRIWMYR